MTYDAYETGRFTGRPVEIYKFTYGSGPNDYYAFTDHERVISLTGVDYQPRAIMRDEVRTGGGRERSDLKIELPNKEPMLDLFQVYPPDQAISVVIRAGHVSDPDQEFIAVFSGTLVSVKNKNDGWAEVLCRPLSAAGRQSGLRRHFQLGCPHVLYGNQCGAVEAPLTATVTSLGASNNKVNLVGGWNGAFGGEKFIGGFIRWSVGQNTRRRTILSVNANELTVAGPITDVDPGDTIEVVLGCNHQMDDCLNIHNAIHDFGGQPWIPTKNPVNTNPYV